jgi:hypothetical protein
MIDGYILIALCFSIYFWTYLIYTTDLRKSFAWNKTYGIPLVPRAYVTVKEIDEFVGV